MAHTNDAAARVVHLPGRPHSLSTPTWRPGTALTHTQPLEHTVYAVTYSSSFYQKQVSAGGGGQPYCTIHILKGILPFQYLK